MFILWLCISSSLISWGMIGGLRWYALKMNLLDIPNHRSSHVIPVPRGAGLGIVFSFLLGICFLFYLGLANQPTTIAFIASGFIVALFGFLDDVYTVPARTRLVGHFLAAIVALYFFKGMPLVIFFGWELPVGGVANTLAVFYLVWLLNLYNFMDGIDGLAGIETLSVCLGGALLYWLTGNHVAMVFPLLLAAPVAGFLYWNFPRARIFMGDVGSGFLGLMLGVFSIQAGIIRQELFMSWLILLGVFIVDATLTLIIRAIKGDKLFEAHSTHAYQHASRYYQSHVLVSIVICLINVLWLLPIAILVAIGYLDGLLGLLIAYTPLAVAAKRFNAGKSYPT